MALVRGGEEGVSLFIPSQILSSANIVDFIWYQQYSSITITGIGQLQFHVESCS